MRPLGLSPTTGDRSQVIAIRSTIVSSPLIGHWCRPPRTALSNSWCRAPCCRMTSKGHRCTVRLPLSQATTIGSPRVDHHWQVTTDGSLAQVTTVSSPPSDRRYQSTTGYRRRRSAARRPPSVRRRHWPPPTAASTATYRERRERRRVRRDRRGRIRSQPPPHHIPRSAARGRQDVHCQCSRFISVKLS